MKKIVHLCLMTLFVTLPLTGFRSVSTASVSFEKSRIQTENKFTDFINVGVTYYNPVVSQCDSDPLVTASMAKIDTSRITQLKWCAISFDLHKRFGGPLSFGDTVILEYEGKKGQIIQAKYVVNDLMNRSLKSRVDILCAVGDKGLPRENMKLKHPKVIEHKTKIALKEQQEEISCIMNKFLESEKDTAFKSEFYTFSKPISLVKNS